MMKNKIKLIVLLAFVANVFVSCNEEDPIAPPVEPKVSYIINYGSYTGDKSTITAFDKETGEVSNGIYENINGVAMVSNVQHASSHNSKIYFAGNSSDQLFWVDGETFEQTENGITQDIIKPRFSVGAGNYLYVSCWGGDIWLDETTSYIAKVNLTTKTVEDKIALPGGPEGLAIANNKLYAALNYKDSVAVIDLSNTTISYIETPAVSSYFVTDNSDNLYVSLVSTYSDPSTETGLGYINTSSDQLETTINLPGVSSAYVNIMASNSNFSKIYLVTEGVNWDDPGAIAVFDVATKSFETDKFIESVPGINGVACYDDKIFCFIAANVTGNGKAQTYNPDGSLVNEFETGIAPFMLLTVK